jgi:hypothetical protein
MSARAHQFPQAGAVLSRKDLRRPQVSWEPMESPRHQPFDHWFRFQTQDTHAYGYERFVMRDAIGVATELIHILARKDRPVAV